MIRYSLVTLLFLCSVGVSFEALAILPPDQAFKLSVKSQSRNMLVLSWDIADGYYLYRDKYKFLSKTDSVSLGVPVIPKGKIKHDDYFGDVEILRDHVEIKLPLVSGNQSAGELDLDVAYQGCADIGICYPPEKKTLKIPLEQSLSKSKSVQVDLNQSFSNNRELFGLNVFQDELLPADEAFRFQATVQDETTLKVSWVIADGYYLYREKFDFSIVDAQGVGLGRYQIPHGSPQHDEAFGDVEVFRQAVDFELPLTRDNTLPVDIGLVAHYQGCADKGVCYPPIEKKVSLQLPEAGMDAVLPAQQELELSEQDQIARDLSHDSLWLTAATFFGFGLLLAFTPCVFPMIPILSGIIVGQGQSITTLRAFLLSLSYVFASALTYTVFGVVAGKFGSQLNLQVVFQTPWVIASFSGIFVLLALSMFDFYTLQMPGFIQSRLVRVGNKPDRGTFWAAALMGALSTLIVGPCVAAPLAGALVYIGQTGDALLGGVALFAMGMGMGFPLLVLGASAGKLLPKAGVWMNATKAVFGVGLLVVAVWLLQRILPDPVSMLLWSALLIIPAVYLGAVDALPQPASGWAKLWKGCGIIMLTAGVILIIGVASGRNDPLQPLSGFSGVESSAQTHGLDFLPVRSVAEVDRYLEVAHSSGQWVMLDYYADWCISCKEMDRYTFTDQGVQKALSKMILIQADVTDDSLANKELLGRYNLVGPPATLFFGPDMLERGAYRVVGFKSADIFLEHLNRFLPNG